jgi:CheY-like chemotaxis protein
MMKDDVVILVVEDDPGHAALIEKNLRRAGVRNEIVRLADGQEALDFLLRRGDGPKRKLNIPYILLLDIRMPRVDGVEVLRQIKQDEELKKLLVIMLTTTDDPHEVERCHRLGCGVYIAKPVDSDRFIDAVKQLGHLLQAVQVPQLDGVA